MPSRKCTVLLAGNGMGKIRLAVRCFSFVSFVSFVVKIHRRPPLSCPHGHDQRQTGKTADGG